MNRPLHQKLEYVFQVQNAKSIRTDACSLRTLSLVLSFATPTLRVLFLYLHLDFAAKATELDTVFGLISALRGKEMVDGLWFLLL